MRGTVALAWVVVAACSRMEGEGGEDPSRGGEGRSCESHDRDDDGYSDVVEAIMQTGVDDPQDHPAARGELVFEVPSQRPSVPPSHDAATRARLERADVAILLDTTGSMAGTVSRIQPQFAAFVAALAGEVDDLAFGAAGYGDIPMDDNHNSYADVPFYPVHRVMTARTAAGLASIVETFVLRNIIVDGVGPWFAVMRGGDEPELGWEALRQLATGIGLDYPLVHGGSATVQPFSSAVYPGEALDGEEVGERGGLGFRADSVPIVIMVSDTSHHGQAVATTSPALADRAVALAALGELGAKVIGLMA